MSHDISVINPERVCDRNRIVHLCLDAQRTVSNRRSSSAALINEDKTVASAEQGSDGVNEVSCPESWATGYDE